MSSLTASQISEFKAAFAVFDPEHNGTIKTERLVTVMSSLGCDASAEELARVLSEVETDQSDELDFSEFLQLMELKLASSDTNDEYERAFKLMDTDNDGFVGEEDLTGFMKTIGESLTEADVKEMIREGDSSGTGKMDLEGFKKLMAAI